MKTSNAAAYKAALRFTGLVLFSMAAIGTGATCAETFRHGNSTATIEQSGGGTSRSEVTHYRDGQKIITRDGSNTDITIQGESGSLAPDFDWGFPFWDDDPFDRRAIEERFSHRIDDDSDVSISSEREAFKQKMMERMRSRFSH